MIVIITAEISGSNTPKTSVNHFIKGLVTMYSRFFIVIRLRSIKKKCNFGYVHKSSDNSTFYLAVL
jgi:hypothetical protein